MTVLELTIVILHCRKDGRVGLCVFVHDIVRYVAVSYTHLTLPTIYSV